MGIAGCDVHEFPETKTVNPNPEFVDFTIHLEYDTKLPLFQTINLTRVSSDLADYDVRYTVNIYGADHQNLFSNIPDTSIVFTKSVSTLLESLDDSLKVTLLEGRYRFGVWTDFVLKDTKADLFYNTQDFNKIMLNKEVALTDFRDAFKGFVETKIDISTTEVTIENVRPLAKIKFQSTDYNEFLEIELSKKDNKKRVDISDLNLSEYRVVFKYINNLPSTFNLFSDAVTDNWKDISFEGIIFDNLDGTADLGFDYVFIGTQNTEIVVQVDVYDDSNELIAQSNYISIPIARSKLTVVKSLFLTTRWKGSFDINTDYDGVFDLQF